MSTATCNFNSPGVLALREVASVLGFAINPNLCRNLTTSYDESIEQIEANGRDRKQIHGSDVGRDIPQEGATSLPWRPLRLTINLATVDCRRSASRPHAETHIGSRTSFC